MTMPAGCQAAIRQNLHMAHFSKFTVFTCDVSIVECYI